MSISVTFASRGRPDSLITAVTSLTQNAARPGDLEIIIAVDPDDDASHDLVQDGHLPAPARLWTAPERFGYNNLHLYLNALAKQATGDWVFWFNDDMLMQTPGWDDIIDTHRPAVIWPYANHVPHANIAPAWPRAWSERLGQASPYTNMDTYWQRIGEALGRHDRVPVFIVHNRADVTGENNDETYAEGRKLLGAEGMAPGWDEAEFVRRWTADALVIHALLAQEQL